MEILKTVPTSTFFIFIFRDLNHLLIILQHFLELDPLLEVKVVAMPPPPPPPKVSYIYYFDFKEYNNDYTVFISIIL